MTNKGTSDTRGRLNTFIPYFLSLVCVQDCFYPPSETHMTRARQRKEANTQAWVGGWGFSRCNIHLSNLTGSNTFVSDGKLIF